jgi:hypothetical protein
MLPNPTRALDKKLEARAVARDAALRKRAPMLKEHLVAEWHDDPLLVMDKGMPWIVMPFDKDPLRTKDGGYPFPKKVKRELQTLVAAGVDFDTLAVAHELDPKGPVAPYVAKIPPAGLLCSENATKSLVGTTPATEVNKRMAATLNRAGDAVVDSAPKVLLGLALAPVVVVAAPLALVAGAVSGVDPIVFGVLHVDHQPHHKVSLWYPLAAWKW